MNAFTSYAAQKARPDRPNRKANMAPSPLEAKMREKQRLSRAYRVWKRAETKAVLASEPRLSGFLRYLRTVTVERGGELIEAIVTCEWLRAAPLEVRIFALRMVSMRCDRLNQQLGNDILDDPIPPQTSIYFEARRVLEI